MKSRIALLGFIVSSVCATVLAWPSNAVCQPAADKATARQLATESIQLFRQERFREALDKMERAETLYDAPIHLLYIARCQTKLGRLVEASEVYRRLVRVELSAQAPQTFRDAIADGQKELALIEPTIPALRIDVSPNSAKGLQLTIDRESVSTAILGVNRPTNPGAHTIRAEAPGFVAAEKSVRLEPSSKQVVALELAPVAPGDVVPASKASPSASGSDIGQSGDSPSNTQRGAITGAFEPAPAANSTRKSSAKRPVKLVLGLGYSALIATGKIDRSDQRTGKADDRTLSGRYGAGSALEFRGGLSIPVGLYRLTPHIFGDLAAHMAGPLYKTSVGDSFEFAQPKGSKPSLESASYSGRLGLGIRFDSDPGKQWHVGGFGELGLIPKELFQSDIRFAPGTTELSGQSCKFSERFSGAALRLASGVLVPLAKVFAVEARVSWTVGQFTHRQRTPACEFSPGNPLLIAIPSEKIPEGERALHHTVSLGIGGQFEIGL